METPPGDTSARPCVLVADDNPINRLVAVHMLAYWGIKPFLSMNGGEAVVSACALRPDLILMDLQMPVLDGWAATRQIRLFERVHARVRGPIVAYTSCDVSTGHALLRDCGFDAVLVKPCDLQALHACLVRWRVPGLNVPVDAKLVSLGRAPMGNVARHDAPSFE